MARSGLFSESYADSFALTSKFISGKARVGLKNPFSMLDHESMTCKIKGCGYPIWTKGSTQLQCLTLQHKGHKGHHHMAGKNNYIS